MECKQNWIILSYLKMNPSVTRQRRRPRPFTKCWEVKNPMKSLVHRWQTILHIMKTTYNPSCRFRDSPLNNLLSKWQWLALQANKTYKRGVVSDYILTNKHKTCKCRCVKSLIDVVSKKDEQWPSVAKIKRCRQRGFQGAVSQWAMLTVPPSRLQAASDGLSLSGLEPGHS